MFVLEIQITSESPILASPEHIDECCDLKVAAVLYFLSSRVPFPQNSFYELRIMEVIA